MTMTGGGTNYRNSGLVRTRVFDTLSVSLVLCLVVVNTSNAAAIATQVTSRTKQQQQQTYNKCKELCNPDDQLFFSPDSLHIFSGRLCKEEVNENHHKFITATDVLNTNYEINFDDIHCHEAQEIARIVGCCRNKEQQPQQQQPQSGGIINNDDTRRSLQSITNIVDSILGDAMTNVDINGDTFDVTSVLDGINAAANNMTGMIDMMDTNEIGSSNPEDMIADVLNGLNDVVNNNLNGVNDAVGDALNGMNDVIGVGIIPADNVTSVLDSIITAATDIIATLPGNMADVTDLESVITDTLNDVSDDIGGLDSINALIGINIIPVDDATGVIDSISTVVEAIGSTLNDMETIDVDEVLSNVATTILGGGENTATMMNIVNNKETTGTNDVDVVDNNDNVAVDTIPPTRSPTSTPLTTVLPTTIAQKAVATTNNKMQSDNDDETDESTLNVISNASGTITMIGRKGIIMAISIYSILLL